jgi:hypothetical protein
VTLLEVIRDYGIDGEPALLTVVDGKIMYRA